MLRPALLVMAMLIGASVGACAVLSGLDNLEKVGNDAGLDAAMADVPTSPDVAVGCVHDTDCTSAADPRCNPADNRCVPCLPQNDNCTGGTFCHEDQGGNFACVRGCKVSADCVVDGGALNADGGAGGETTCCGGICVDTTSDAYNCGACGEACKGTAPACCGSACFDEASDPQHCGGCRNACSSNHVQKVTCGGGACNGACAPNYADCNGDKLTDGCETETDNDPRDCGGCGTACSSANMQTVTCGSGLCNGTCLAGFADCTGTKQSNGCQTNLASDPNHCGGCGNVCSANNVVSVACGNGVCDGACAANYADCNNNKLFDGCETEIDNNVQACGGCGLACSSNNVVAGTLTCSGGQCAGQCNGQFANCDGTLQANGCNVNIDVDPNNCGACGVVCSTANVLTPGCTAGACTPTCGAGFTNCDGTFQTNGCNVNLNTDPNNCGGCGTVCSSVNIANQGCAGGGCDGTCASGFANCDATLQQNGCNVNTNTDSNNCGGCGNVCNPPQACNGAGVCQ